MPDQPQNPTSPNAARIQAMLNDLSRSRQDEQAPQTQQPASPTQRGEPVPAPRVPRVPPNPLAGAPQRPPAGLPTRPAPQPTAPSPKPAVPSITPPPRLPEPPRPPVTAPTTRPAIPTPPVPPRIAEEKPLTATKEGHIGELRTMSGDIGHITTGQAPEGVKVEPATPVLSTKPTPQSPVGAPSPITVPPASSGGMVRKLLYGVIFLAAVALITIGVLWATGGQTEPTPTPSPTPTPVLMSTKNLEYYFGKASTAASIFDSPLIAQPQREQAVVLDTVRDGENVAPATFLSEKLGTLPTGLESALAPSWTALAYGQNEQFDASGARMVGQSVTPRIGVIIEVFDASATTQSMYSWEATLPAATAQLFGHAVPSQTASFNSGTNGQLPVRYINLPYPDHSIDYAIVLASNGKNYLVITSSRESMSFMIAQLMQ